MTTALMMMSHHGPCRSGQGRVAARSAGSVALLEPLLGCGGRGVLARRDRSWRLDDAGRRRDARTRRVRRQPHHPVGQVGHREPAG